MSRVAKEFYKVEDQVQELDEDGNVIDVHYEDEPEPSLPMSGDTDGDVDTLVKRAARASALDGASKRQKTDENQLSLF